LRDKKIREKIDRYTQPLKDRYGVRIYLEPPALPMTSVKEGGSPTLGPVDAPVTVFEYSDYQCPSCRKAHEVSIQIRERFKGRIRWVFKDYPLERHRESRLMAQAARCAGEQERFWEYQDLLYTGSSRPDSETLVGFARQLELDEAAFSQCLDDGKYQAIIEKEKAAARDSGVSSTPTFIINGRLSPGYMSFDRMAALIEQELEKFD
jgi:protein-disulfide isomerase